MKNVGLNLSVAMGCWMAFSVSAYGQTPVRVSVDGQRVEFQGAQPQQENGSVLVPLRGVFEQMGAYVGWNEATQEVYATKGDREIRLRIGRNRATINGRSVALTTPARLIDGSTMVPLRFLGESLGAEVVWNPVTEMVMLNTDSMNGRAGRIVTSQPQRKRPSHRDAYAIMARSTVLPVQLDQMLSSNESRAGDRFTATVDTRDRGYSALPEGTRIEGHVISAKRQRDSEPGMLELKFDRIVFLDGKEKAIDGSLVSLDDKQLTRGANGRMTATGKAKDNRSVYAGYGAGAGLIVGLISKRPLEDTLLGALLGYGAGALEKPKQNPSDVRLGEGTRLGVRLNQAVTLYTDER